MSTTTYQNTHSSKSFPRRNIRRATSINPMTNDRSQYPLKPNHLLAPIPPIRESLDRSESLTTSRYRSHTNETASSQKPYTFSNKPREIGLNRRSSLRHRVSSAPDENSPRSRLNQLKSSSANGSLTPRSYGNNNHQSSQKDSLNALLKQQEKSTVPKAVQRRRIVLLFHRSSPRQEQNPSPISNQNPIQSQFIQPDQPTENIPTIQPLDNMDPEMADTMQLAAILANIQLQDDYNPNSVSPNSQQQKPTLDPSRYEYVVASPLDTATFRLSPRTLKPDEELAARLRFCQHYRTEMRSSANAQIPPLMASIVTENNSTIGNVMDPEQTFTFKLNSTDTNKKQKSFDDDESLESTSDNELLQLCYDATLKRFYDPNTGRYYELTSA